MNATITKIGAKHLENLRFCRDIDTTDSHKLILLSKRTERCLIVKPKTCNTEVRDDRKLFNETVDTIKIKYGKLKSDNTIRMIKDDRIEYIKNNPQSCSIEEWERVAYGICRDIGFKVSLEDVTKEQCDLAFEISRDIIPNECLVPMFIVERLQNCSVDFRITKRTKEQCKIDYKMLVEQVDNCNLSFSEYYDLNKKGLSFSALREIYNNALSVRLVSGKVQLIGKINKYIIGEDISFDDNSVISGLGDRLSYLKKITEDLNLPEQVIKEIFAN